MACFAPRDAMGAGQLDERHAFVVRIWARADTALRFIGPEVPAMAFESPLGKPAAWLSVPDR
jgi:hypothetical protein